MKMFEQETKPQDAAVMLLALFREFKAVPGGEVSKAISPSGLGCQVACAWKLRGTPTQPEMESFQSRGFAENGEDRHKRIQEFLSQTPYWVDVEKYIADRHLPLQVVRHDGFEVLLWSEEYQCRFKCDGMLKIDGQYYILEIKTERQQSNTYRTGPEEKHQKQGITYTLLLGTDRIMWVYEGRDYLEQKPYVQQVTKEDKVKMASYIKSIIQNKDFPEKLERNLKACTYCQYKQHCKMYFKELVNKEK